MGSTGENLGKRLRSLARKQTRKARKAGSDQPIQETLEVFKVGPGPRPGPGGGKNPDGTHSPHNWQGEAFVDLRKKLRRSLIGPTGSGKSFLARMLACEDMESGLRAVVAVPMKIISTAFRPVRIRRDDGHVYEWRPRVLIDQTSAVRKLIQFLRDDTSTPSAIVCTHSALVRAFRWLAGQKSADQAKILRRLSLFIDESHHIKNGIDENNGELRNQLGHVVETSVAGNIGAIMLSTATWTRTDRVEIIPPKYRDVFRTVLLPVDRYLREMKYLEKISFRFLIGNPEASLRLLAEENASRRTIVYLPPVGSALLPEKEEKYKAVGRYQRSVGPIGRGASWAQQHRTRKGWVKSVDLVTELGREDRRRRLLEAIEAGRCDISWIFALMMATEGFDYPELERACIVGARGSMLLVEQMFGRIMRDCKGKTEAQLNFLLPGVGRDQPELLHDYLKVMLASLLYQSLFQPVDLRKLTKKDKDLVNRALSDKSRLLDTIHNVLEAAEGQVESGNEDYDIREAIRMAGFDLEKGGLAEETVVEHVKRLFTNYTKQMLRKASEIPFDVALKHKVYGGVRMFLASFGYSDLADFRRALGKRPTLTDAFVNRLILDWHRGSLRGLTKRREVNEGSR